MLVAEPTLFILVPRPDRYVVVEIRMNTPLFLKEGYSAGDGRMHKIRVFPFIPPKDWISLIECRLVLALAF